MKFLCLPKFQAEVEKIAQKTSPLLNTNFQKPKENMLEVWAYIPICIEMMISTADVKNFLHPLQCGIKESLDQKH